MSRGGVLVLLALGAASCVYYNGMWSAERLAQQARKAERQGSSQDARSLWASAAVKAESIVARHPRSRWAEPALVLRGEGLAKSGACDRAAAPLAQALGAVRAEGLRERVALALAECALEADDPATASRQLAPVTTSGDHGRRSRATLLAGRAAELAGDYAAAAQWYGRSADPGAAPARARVLLAAGRTAEALALVDTLARGRFRENDWGPLLEEVARATGPDSASGALDRLRTRARMPVGARGRLLLADGDRLLAAGHAPAAGVRYAQVVRLMPDSLEGQQAGVRELRALAMQADSLGDFVAVRARLGRLTESAASGDARSLEVLLRRVLNPDDVEEGREFRTAELVRDSVGAPRLGGRLFVGFARRHPGSLFTPKALVAAVALLPDARDSLIAVLDARYPTSPYTLALRGDASPAFAAAEDSLAQTLGLELAAPLELRHLERFAPPVPGPRGPGLDPPGGEPVAAAPPVAGPRGEGRVSPPGAPDDGRVRRPRPASQPRDSL